MNDTPHFEVGAAAPGVTPALPEGGRAGRPRGRRPRSSEVDGALRLETQTTKTYRLGDDGRRTAGYLRLILNQRHVPDEARVTIDAERLTVEWSE